MLKEADLNIYKDSLNYISLLSSDSFKLNEELLTLDMSDPLWGEDKLIFEIPDSLRTHPNTDSRIEKLNQNNIAFGDEIEKLEFVINSIKEEILIESLNTMVINYDLSNALHKALLLKQRGMKHLFIDEVIAFSLFETAYAIKTNKFSNYVPFPNTDFDFEYNRTLNLMHHLNSRKANSLFRGLYQNFGITFSGELSDYISICFENNDFTFNKNDLELFKKKWGENSIFTDVISSRIVEIPIQTDSKNKRKKKNK
jgi:hypothetical protein